MTDWPKVRVAHKDGEFHMLWPGELAGPFKRSGYEIQEYAPTTTQPKDTHLSGDGERLEHYAKLLDDGVQPDRAAFAAFLRDLATRLTPESGEEDRLAKTLKRVCWHVVSTDAAWRKAAEDVLTAHPRLSPENSSGVEEGPGERFTLDEVRGRLLSREALSAGGVDLGTAIDMLAAGFPGSAATADSTPFLTPDECRELFSLWLLHGMRPPEIDESHPSFTGAQKLGQAQPHPEDPEGEPTGASLPQPDPTTRLSEGTGDQRRALQEIHNEASHILGRYAEDTPTGGFASDVRKLAEAGLSMEGGEEGLRERLLSDEAINAVTEVLDDEFAAGTSGEAVTDYALAKRLLSAALATTQKPQDEECEHCKDTGHDWEPGPTGEPVSAGPCPDCQPQDEEER